LSNKIIFTSKWVEKLFGGDKRDYCFEVFNRFNKLNLLDEEKAVLFPYLITKYSNQTFFSLDKSF
jgi:hypothetical protein